MILLRFFSKGFRMTPFSVTMAFDQGVGCHIEGRIKNAGPFRGDPLSLKMGDFLRSSLFNRNVLPGSQGKVERGCWGRHIKRDPVPLREDGKTVRPNLVGRISVPGDPVCADDRRDRSSPFSSAILPCCPSRPSPGSSPEPAPTPSVSLPGARALSHRQRREIVFPRSRRPGSPPPRSHTLPWPGRPHCSGSAPRRLPG